MYKWFLWCLAMGGWMVATIAMVRADKKKNNRHSNCLWDFKGAVCKYKGPKIECDKTLESCRGKFDNSKHFGGFLGLGRRGNCFEIRLPDYSKKQFFCIGELNVRPVGIVEISRPSKEVHPTTRKAWKEFAPGDHIYVLGIYLDDRTVFNHHFLIQEWESFCKEFAIK